MDAVALKLSKFGGLSALRRARDLCLHLGAKMCIEDTWGSGHRHRRGAASGGVDHRPARCSMSATCRAMSRRAWTRMRRATDGRIARPTAPAWASTDATPLGAPDLILDLR
jgi:hypothetical protein